MRRLAIIITLLISAAVPAVPTGDLAVAPLDPAEWLSVALCRWLAEVHPASTLTGHDAGDVAALAEAAADGGSNGLLVINCRYLGDRARVELYLWSLGEGPVLVDVWQGIISHSAFPVELPPALERLLSFRPSRGPTLAELKNIYLNNG